MGSLLRNLLKQRSGAQVVPGMTARDLSDIALSRADMLALITAPPQLADRVASMAAAFGVTDEMISQDRRVHTEILTACATCPHGDRCDYTFAMDLPIIQADLQDCPNRAIYVDLAAQR
jgi:cytochrome c553